MAKKWYEFVTIRAALIGAVAAIIAAVIMGLFGLFSNDHRDKNFLYFQDRKWSNYQTIIDQAKFKPNEYEVGIHVLQFEDEAKTEKGAAAAAAIAGHIQNELNKRIEAGASTKIWARDVHGIYVESHEEARDLGAHHYLNSDIMVWGSVLRFPDDPVLYITPRITIVDTTKRKYPWDREIKRELDLPFVSFPIPNKTELEFPTQPIDTPYQLSLYLVAYGLNELDRKKEALELLEKAVEIPNDYKEHLDIIYAFLGNLYYYFHDYDRSLKAYETAVELNPTDSNNLFSLASAYSDVGFQNNSKELSEKAFALYEKLLPSEQYKQTIYSNMGVLSMELGDTDQAAIYFNRALSIDSTLAFAYGNLGKIYFYSGKIDSAISLTKRAIELDSSLGIARSNYAAFLYAKGDTVRAIAELNKAIKAHPEQVDLYLNLGAIYMGQGNLQDALSCFEKAAQIAPLFPAVYATQAAILSFMGKTDKAYELLEMHLDDFIKGDRDPTTTTNTEYGVGVIPWIMNGVEFENVRKDSRWPTLRAKLTKSN